MSKGISSIFWMLRQSIGQHKFTTRADGEIIGSMKGKKNPSYKDPKKREARDLRIAGYGGCGKITRVLKEVLREGFLERKKNQSAVNAFVKKNVKKVCTATRDAKTKEIVLEYDFDVMEVAAGTLDQPTVTATVDLETSTVTFQQEGEVIPGGLAHEDDKVFGCLFSVNNTLEPAPAVEYLMKSLLVNLRERGENGSTTVEIPKGWNKANLFVYYFAASADGKYSSPSARAFPPPTAQEIIIEELENEWENARLRLAILRVSATPEQLQAIADSGKNERKVGAKAEEEALKAGKSPFDAQIEAIRARVKMLNEI